MMTPQQERARLFEVVWRLAMEVATPPIRTPRTTIPASLAKKAFELLTELGYDWQDGRREWRGRD